jgi:hypothetical protein
MEKHMPGGVEDMRSLAIYAGEGNGDEVRQVPVKMSFHVETKFCNFSVLGRTLDIGTLGFEARFSNLEKAFPRS